MAIQQQIDKFNKIYDVSRETIKKLTLFHDLIVDNQKSRNLIGPGTIKEIWIRHFADSAKIVELLTKSHHGSRKRLSICDVGSGAGFPGVVCSILLNDMKISHSMTLIESNKRKCEFLQDVTENIGISCVIINSRAEKISKKFDFVISRAVAPLTNLLKNTSELGNRNTIFILPKGKKWRDEIKESKKIWSFSLNIVKNNTLLDDSGGVTLEIKKLNRK